ncbi:MAG: tetratricopeptide repeat protein, partial [Myxococcales bacterium]|nr:tetratricopeptide repeat protein [Myxococcales bacterium]
MRRWHPAWVGVLAFALYLPTLSYGLISRDDPWLIKDNRLLKNPSWENVGIVLTDFGSDTRHHLGAEYLPIRDLSVMLDYALFGDWFPGHRLMHIGVYGLACALAATFVLLWFRRRDWAWIAGGLFAVHPIHVEAAAWLSERKGLLAAAFLFASLCAFRPFVDRPSFRRLVWPLGLLILAIGSKAVAVAGLASFWMLLWLRPGEVDDSRRRTSLQAWSGVVILSVLGLLAFLPAYAVGQQQEMILPPHADSLGGSLLLFGAIHAKYLGLLSLGSPLAIDYPPPGGGPTMGALGLLLFLLFLGIAAYGAYRRGPWVMPAFAAGFWVTQLLPVSHLLFPIQNLLADRYLFLPLLSATLTVAWAYSHLPSRVRLALPITVGVVAAAISVFQMGTWRSSEDLYLRAVKVSPTYAQGWSHLALMAYERGDMGLARKMVEQGRSHSPEDWHLLQRAALIENRQGNRQQAIALLRRAARDPAADSAMANLAFLLMAQGRFAEAQQWATRSVAVNPRYARGFRVLGLVLLESGATAASIAPLQRALALDPDNAENHFGLGLAYWMEGETERAKASLGAATKIDPGLAGETDAILEGNKRYKP